MCFLILRGVLIDELITSQFARVTWSRITLSFFLIALANGAAQTTIQTIALSMSARGRDLVSETIDAAGVQRGFVVVQGNAIEICSGIPIVHGTMCDVAYNGSMRDVQGVYILASKLLRATTHASSRLARWDCHPSRV